MDPKPSDAYRLNDASYKEMLRPQVTVPNSPLAAPLALGWQSWHLAKGEIFAHGGDDTGFHSEAAFSIPRKSGFVILTNGDNGADLIMNRLLRDLVDHFI